MQEITRLMRSSTLWAAALTFSAAGVSGAERLDPRGRAAGPPSAGGPGLRIQADGVNYSLVTQTYCTVGGKPLKADVLTPLGRPKPPSGWPVLELLHGGAWTSGSRADVVQQYPDEVAQFINAGFRLIVPDYRLGPSAQWPAMIEDAKCAVRFARANPSNDSSQVYCLGSSAGGHLCSLLAVTDDTYHNDSGSHAGLSGKVRAGVSYCAPSKLWDEARGAPAQYLIDLFPPGRPNPVLQTFGNGDPDLLLDASVVRFPTSDAAPLRLAHGKLDMTVPASESANLHALLKGVGVAAQLQLVPGAGHQFRPYLPGSPTRRAVAASSLTWIRNH